MKIIVHSDEPQETIVMLKLIDRGDYVTLAAVGQDGSAISYLLDVCSDGIYLCGFISPALGFPLTGNRKINVINGDK
jgi:hypothetical protein